MVLFSIKLELFIQLMFTYIHYLINLIFNTLNNSYNYILNNYLKKKCV